MAVVWKHPGVDVTDATGFVNDQRPKVLSERTIATVLRRLDAKGYVTHGAKGRAFLYTAIVPQREFVMWHGRRAYEAFVERYGDEIAISGIVERANADDQTRKRLEELLAEGRTT